MRDTQQSLDLSITLVSTNQLHLLQNYMPSAFAIDSKASFEFLVVDNACTDGTAEWVYREFPQVQVICNERRQSYSANMNIGMKTMKRGRYFVVLNPDIKCMPDLFDSVVAFMDANPQIGMVGPQLLNPDRTVQHSCRRFSTPLSLLIRGLRLDAVLRDTSVVRDYLMLDFNHDHVNDVDWVMGALMFVRREAIDTVGGMDERYAMTYSDDQDWCCAMWHGGWRVVYFPHAHAVHVHQRSGMRNPFGKMGRIQTINALRMFRKFNWHLTRVP